MNSANIYTEFIYLRIVFGDEAGGVLNRDMTSVCAGLLLDDAVVEGGWASKESIELPPPKGSALDANGSCVVVEEEMGLTITTGANGSPSRSGVGAAAALAGAACGGARVDSEDVFGNEATGAADIGCTGRDAGAR